MSRNEHESAGPLIIPDRTPSFAIGKPRPSARVVMRSAPELPSMPMMLAPDPEEAGVTAVALKAMMGTDFRDDARTKALGAALRTVVAGALLGVTATLLWGVAWLYADADLLWLVVAWVGALVITVLYFLASERMDRRFSSAGVELRKIDAATEMHYDRLEARKEMHRDAVQSWERVMLAGLDHWERGLDTTQGEQ